MDNPQERNNLFVRHNDVPASPGGHGDSPVDTGACRAVAPVLNRVGDKWSMLIVMNLAAGPRRFNELKRQIDGISQRMLTLSLRGLERDGLVSRKVTPSIPPRVDYALTDLGVSLRAPVQQLGNWAIAHIDCIRAAQRAFDDASHQHPDQPRLR